MVCAQLDERPPGGALYGGGRPGQTFLCNLKTCGWSFLFTMVSTLLPTYLCSFSKTCFSSCVGAGWDAQKLMAAPAAFPVERTGPPSQQPQLSSRRTSSSRGRILTSSARTPGGGGLL